MERWKKLFWEAHSHCWYIYHFIKDGNWEWSWCRKENKFIGPWYMWYDGPHYAFGFWWFQVNLDYFNEDRKRDARHRLIVLLGKLCNKRDWF